MKIPFEPSIFGISINIHLVLEYVAFFIAYRYYQHLRKNTDDSISTPNRLSIILGAAIGAYIGSRLIGFLENPLVELSANNLINLLNTKTIMGGLFGGLLGVELVKKIIHEKQSSGDLFTLPLVVGIFIGRIGCFLMGTNEFTYGKETTVIFGMDLGDGILRHPLALYELVFLALLFLLVYKKSKTQNQISGDLFQSFMLSYFGFRFFIEFLKPTVFFVFGLSTIQWLCILCFVYYKKRIIRIFRYAS